MMKLIVAAAAIGAVMLGAASTQADPAYNGPVVVVVSIPIPPAIPRAAILDAFNKQSPAFQALPNLKQKYFTVNDETHRAGGIYLWTNAAAAKAFYSDKWKSGVQSTFGAPAELTWFDAPVIIQGKAGMP